MCHLMFRAPEDRRSERRIARLENAYDGEAASFISSAHPAEVVALVESGALNDRLARQVIESVWRGTACRRQLWHLEAKRSCLTPVP